MTRVRAFSGRLQAHVLWEVRRWSLTISYCTRLSVRMGAVPPPPTCTICGSYQSDCEQTCTVDNCVVSCQSCERGTYPPRPYDCGAAGGSCNLRGDSFYGLINRGTCTSPQSPPPEPSPAATPQGIPFPLEFGFWSSRYKVDT